MMARDIFCSARVDGFFRIVFEKRIKLGANLFEKLVCLKDWIDAEERLQHDTTLESTTRAVPTQESGTNMIISPDDVSDGACDIHVEDNDLWYLNDDY
jgi:hypothetical protein